MKNLFITTALFFSVGGFAGIPAGASRVNDLLAQHGSDACAQKCSQKHRACLQSGCKGLTGHAYLFCTRACETERMNCLRKCR